MSKKIGRNDPCPCGSGKKYKNCHFKPENSLASKQNTDREETFRKVFEELPFPYLAIDEWEISKVINSNHSPHSHVGISLIADSPKNDALRGAIRGIFRKIEPTKYMLPFLNNSSIISSVIPIGADIAKLIESDNNHFKTYTSNGKLIWEELSYWPIAYSTFINQISNIIQVFHVALTERFKELKKTSSEATITSEYARNMPTSIHYAAASLGAWLGGASNIQYFSLYATRPQIKKSETNISYYKRIGYSQEDGVVLDAGGIIAVPASLALPLIQAQGSSSIFGSIPVDEFNMINLPKNEVLNFRNGDEIKTGPAGLIIDKYYRSPFFARKLQNHALYGEKNVLQDHYTEFYKSIKHDDFMRCKHYCMPIIEVSDSAEILETIKRIPMRGEGKLFFRGQPSYHAIKRNEKVKQLLFGNSHSSEPSLTTSACRNNYDYDTLHFGLKHFLGQDRLFKNQENTGDLTKNISKWKEMSINPSCEYDYAVMALAQHYGLPSHGLDVTTNVDVALWFATNKYSKTGGISRYTKLTRNDWHDDKTKWPIVFVFQNILHTVTPSLQDCHELTELGITALRPLRQNAKFFLGGHSDHQNRLAESLVCAFRLRPGEYPTKCDFEYLFPDQSADSAYKTMIDFSNQKLFSEITNDMVNVFSH